MSKYFAISHWLQWVMFCPAFSTKRLNILMFLVMICAVIDIDGTKHHWNRWKLDIIKKCGTKHVCSTKHYSILPPAYAHCCKNCSQLFQKKSETRPWPLDQFNEFWFFSICLFRLTFQKWLNYVKIFLSCRTNCDYRPDVLFLFGGNEIVQFGIICLSMHWTIGSTWYCRKTRKTHDWCVSYFLIYMQFFQQQ